MKIGKILFLLLIASMGLVSTLDVYAGPLRDRIRERMQERAEAAGSAEEGGFADAGDGRAMSCADWAQKVGRLEKRAQGRNAGPAADLRDVAYGAAAREKLDVFFARGGNGPAPVIVMVHGGGWCVGDKAGASMTQNKVERWTPRGFVFVSVNYPMIGDGSNAIAQAGYVAKAVAFVQAHAAKWGGDGQRVILMGHSAGAHLVSLVNADAAIRRDYGVRPVLGTVSLDAGAIDVVTQMPKVYPFLKERYREAFGTTEGEWKAASPYHRLERSAAPWLGVCSTTRKDDPCGQARAYAAKSQSLGIRAAVQPEAKSHGAINQELGEAGPYTRGVEDFMASIDPLVAERLRSR